MLVIKFLCPFKGFPICSPVSEFQRQTTLSIPAEATLKQSGEKETNKTQCLCPEQVCKGVSVYKSHILTVVSPEPEAKFFPSGENATLRIASL